MSRGRSPLAAGGINLATTSWRVVHAPQAKGRRPWNPISGRRRIFLNGCPEGAALWLPEASIPPRRRGVWFMLRRPRDVAPWNPISGRRLSLNGCPESAALWPPEASTPPRRRGVWFMLRKPRGVAPWNPISEGGGFSLMGVQRAQPFGRRRRQSRPDVVACGSCSAGQGTLPLGTP